MNANKLMVMPFDSITKACGIHERKIQQLELVRTNDLTPEISRRLQMHKELLEQCQHTAGRRVDIELMMRAAEPPSPVAPLRAR